MIHSQAFVARVLQLFDKYDQHSALFWRTGEKHRGGCFDVPASFFAECSDVFHWGVSDLQEITSENIDILEQSFIDCRAAGPVEEVYGPWLFAARVREMRPQGAVYEGMEPTVWALFDACGPARERGLGNPVAHPSDKKPEEQST